VSRLKVFGFSGAKNQIGESIANQENVARNFLITFTAITNKVFCWLWWVFGLLLLSWGFSG